MSWIWDRLIKFVDFVSTFLVVIMVGLVGMQIILRYFFRHPFVWADELVSWLFVWLIYLTASYLTRYEGHLTVTVLTERLSHRVNMWRKRVVNLVVLAFLLIAFKQSILLLQTLGNTPSPAMRIPMGFLFVSVTVFVTISIIEYIRQTLSMIPVLFEGKRTGVKEHVNSPPREDPKSLSRG